jgi:hypothetical protein
MTSTTENSSDVPMASSAPSVTESNFNGLLKFDTRCQSVISNPFALLFIFVVNGSCKNITDLISIFISEYCSENLNRDELKLLRQLEKVKITELDRSIDVSEMFKESVNDNNNTTEIQITKSFVEKIQTKKLPFEVTGQKGLKIEFVDETTEYVDVMIKNHTKHDNQSYTPLMVMKVGMNHREWWTKVDQCTKYLEMMISGTGDSQIHFTIPLLMAVSTIDREKGTIRLAVFFCRPKCNDKQFRMTLLWHSKGSFELIGKLFHDVSKFQQLIKIHKESEEQLTTFLNYTYFSSNCCRIGDKVRESVISSHRLAFLSFCIIVFVPTTFWKIREFQPS